MSEPREPTDAEVEAVAYALLDTVWKDRGAWAAASRGDRLLVKVDGELDFRKLARAAIAAMPPCAARSSS